MPQSLIKLNPHEEPQSRPADPQPARLQAAGQRHPGVPGPERGLAAAGGPADGPGAGVAHPPAPDHDHWQLNDRACVYISSREASPYSSLLPWALLCYGHVHGYEYKFIIYVELYLEPEYALSKYSSLC